MQDIKPTGSKHTSRYKKSPNDLPPEAKKLYEEHAKKTPKQRLNGSKVPVTNVHIPKQAPAPTRDARPLFAKVDITKRARNTKKRRISMRLGTKERTILLSLFAVVLLTTGIATFIFLPTASIALTLQTAPLLIDQKFTIAANAAVAPNTVPGNIFEQQVTVNGSFPVTSTEVIGTKAKGTVQLINKTFEKQLIKEGSRLVTKDNVLFYMQQATTIPAATPASSASVTVEVEAAESGEAGNIEPQTLNFAALDSSAQSVVYAQNDTALSGGTGEEVKVVKEMDLEQAKEAAQAQMKIQTSGNVNSQLQKGWLLLEESIRVELNEFTPTGKVGDRIDVVPFIATGTVRVMTYKEDVLMKALENALQASLDQDYMLFPGPISYTKSIDEVDFTNKKVAMTARVTHTTIPTFSIDTLKDKLSNRSKAEAINYLQGLPGIQNATIETWPFWVQSIPKVQNRIDVEFISDRQP